MRPGSRLVPDAMLVLGSVPKVSSRWPLEPLQVQGQGAALGKGEREQLRWPSQQSGRRKIEPFFCFDLSCMAGGTFIMEHGESFTLAVPGFHFNQKRC